MKRLTEKHPTYQKVQKLFDQMEEAKLSFYVADYGQILVKDDEFPETSFELRDLEHEESSSIVQSIYELPPTLEWKVVKRE